MITAWLLALTMTPGRRYDGWRWKTIARYVRRRDRWQCRRCGRFHIPLHVHHKRWVSRGGSYFPTNLIALCGACHEREHWADLDHDGRIGR